MRSYLKEYFGFSKKELNGLTVFCFLLVVMAAAPYVYQALRPVEVYNYSDFELEVNEFLASAAEINNRGKGYKSHSFQFRERDSKRHPEYFNFNPNGLSEQAWQKLGLSPRQIRVIKNFEAKGGRFFQKEDLKKIYSITPQEYAGLEPYIEIPKPSFEDRKKGEFKELKMTVSTISLNDADSASFDALKGIGPAFASRIVKYRERLGGFYKKEQLMEVYGLDSTKYDLLKDQIAVGEKPLRKIRINSVSFDELKKHPYLSYKQVNAIIQYRKQHGRYSSVSDLKKIVIMPLNVILKLEPYLEFDSE